MMPVTGNSNQSESIDYKKKYKALKRKLKFLVYEHESFLEGLKKAQRKLLKVSRDRSFLLDRLLQHEKVDDSSSDSDATASSDSEAEGPKDGVSTKKRKLSGGAAAPALPVYNAEAAPTGVLGAVNFAAALPPQPAQPTTAALVVAPSPGPTAPLPAPEPSALLKQLSSAPSVSPAPHSNHTFTSLVQEQISELVQIAQPAAASTPKATTEPPKKRQKVTKKTPKSGTGTTGRPTVAQALQQQQQLQRQQLQQQQQQVQQAAHVSLAEAIAPGHMTREELERHLEYKQSTKPQFMSIDKAPNMLPDDIFNDNSSDSDAIERQIKEEEELVIDMPME